MLGSDNIPYLHQQYLAGGFRSSLGSPDISRLLVVWSIVIQRQLDPSKKRSSFATSKLTVLKFTLIFIDKIGRRPTAPGTARWGHLKYERGSKKRNKKRRILEH